MYRSVFKRVLDLVCSIAALLALAPLMAIIAIAVRIAMGEPVLYRQPRPGLRERSFTLVKFRTMLPEIDRNGRLLCDTERLTPFGAFLRATSLDELPELWNIMRGDMSLVGPRPLLERYLPFYTSREHRRHDVRPGLTGWAQINGRNGLDWDERLALDVWYVENLSFGLDLQVLLKTITAVVCRRGVQVDPALESSLDEVRRTALMCTHAERPPA
jgi:lipopolysaccharide/colanic/teichoic acid biosynthesis glycosyltransferase